MGQVLSATGDTMKTFTQLIQYLPMVFVFAFLIQAMKLAE